MGLNGYTVCSGVISHELNGPGIILFSSIPLDVDEYMEIGIITRKNTTLTRYGQGPISKRFVSTSRLLRSARVKSFYGSPN